MQALDTLIREWNFEVNGLYAWPRRLMTADRKELWEEYNPGVILPEVSL